VLRFGAKALALFVALAVVAAFGYKQLELNYTHAGPTTAPLRIEIPAGASVRAALARLAEHGAITNPRAVSIYLRVHRLRPSIKAGTYDIPARASAAEIMRLLEEGAVVLEQLTVVEGSTFSELRKLLEHHSAVTVTLRGKTDAEVMNALRHPGEHPEGRFFPDTYRFAAHTTDLEILGLAYASMQRVLDAAWEQRDASTTVRTPYEALILASLVEKETALPAERPRIAGVFVARLRKGMRLQSDPTVIYGLGERYDGDIRNRDLTADTPYNTYTRAGLPPTPIALPGRESIFAAIHPDDTGALYFVATGDGTGAHYFSRTLEEHNEAVRRYLARLRGQSTGTGARGTSTP
jgi:UPF0755 protein